MKLGNIVVEDAFIKHDKILSLNVDILNITNKFIDNGKPTLIIGWRNTKKEFDNKVSILSKKINDKLFWTFNPTERLQDFNEDIDKFVELLTTDFIKNLKYELLDPIILNKKTTDEFLIELPKIIDITYINDEMIYFLSNKIVYGLDLNVLNFLNFNKVEIVKYIENISKKIIFETYDDNGCIYRYNKIFKMNNLEKYIPYIVYNDENSLIKA